MVRIEEPRKIIQQEARIISCQIVHEKLVSQLTDGREKLVFPLTCLMNYPYLTLADLK